MSIWISGIVKLLGMRRAGEASVRIVRRDVVVRWAYVAARCGLLGFAVLRAL